MQWVRSSWACHFAASCLVKCSCDVPQDRGLPLASASENHSHRRKYEKCPAWARCRRVHCNGSIDRKIPVQLLEADGPGFSLLGLWGAGSLLSEAKKKHCDTAPETPKAKACPSMLASSPASMMNQNPIDLGIPNRFSLNSSRFSHAARRSCWRPGHSSPSGARRPIHGRYHRRNIRGRGCSP